jgi:hypothetical protein
MKNNRTRSDNQKRARRKMNLRDKVSFATAFWFIAFVIVCSLYVSRCGELNSRISEMTDESVILQDKQVVDSGDVDNLGGHVIVKGAITGAGVGYKNNEITLSCSRVEGECYYAGISQIGYNQVSGPDPVSFLKIAEWNKSYISAKSSAEDDKMGCMKITVNINRSTKDVEWVEEPINQATPMCDHADNKTYKWFIDSPPSWKRIFGNILKSQ